MTAQCPGCAGTESAPTDGEEVAFDRIWSALEDEFSCVIPLAVRQRYTPAEATRLVTCGGCGLQFFSPAIPGGPDFYESLSTTGYYNKITWEGTVVVRSISDTDDVVDLGCGDGAMLRALGRGRPGRTVGIDHHAAAVNSLHKAGLEGYTDSFEEFAAREPARFDVACAMQVLEHLPDARPLLESCRTVLRPGGRLFLAVPNAERAVDRFEPADYPPHHFSRWTRGDITKLAARFDLEVVGLSYQPGHRQALGRALEGRFPQGRPGWFMSRVVARSLPGVSVQGLLRRLAPDANPHGHTLLAELRRPTAAGPR